MKIKTDTLKEFKDATFLILKKVKQNKKGATTLLLYGDLGAGKTTMSKQIGKIFGVKKTMNSPTFTIIKKYDLKDKNYKKLFHIDAYRLESYKEMEKLHFKEIIENPEHLVLIEWPEKILKILPPKTNKIHISHADEGRVIEVVYSK